MRGARDVTVGEVPLISGFRIAHARAANAMRQWLLELGDDEGSKSLADAVAADGALAALYGWRRFFELAKRDVANVNRRLWDRYDVCEQQVMNAIASIEGGDPREDPGDPDDDMRALYDGLNEEVRAMEGRITKLEDVLSTLSEVLGHRRRRPSETGGE